MNRWRQFGNRGGVSAWRACCRSPSCCHPRPKPVVSDQRPGRGVGLREQRPKVRTPWGRRKVLLPPGIILNRYLKEKAGYELELVATAGVPENVGALLDPARHIDLATIESSSEEGAQADGLYGLATVGRQYFFVIVPNNSAAKEIRDLAGAINPGVRDVGQAPTLGRTVLEY